MSTSRLVIYGLVALTLLRIVLGAYGELTADEAYYFLWSQHPDWSYYSKGPGVAWAIKLGTTIFGDNALGVRIFSPLLALGTSLIFFRLGRALFDEQTAAWAVVLLNVTPIFNAGSVLMTIDPLMMFFWTAAMFTLWRALHRAHPLNLYWPLTGLLIGLGFLCKYTIALQLLSILLLLAAQRRWRGQLRKPGFYLLLLAFALCTLPVLIWNQQHDWITVRHLADHLEHTQPGEEKASLFNPLLFLTFTAGHLGTYSPLLFAGLVWALWRALRRYREDDGETFLLFFALPILVLYFLLSFKQTGELNWTAPGFLTAGLLLARYWQDVELGLFWKGTLRSSAIALAGLMSLVAINTDMARQLGAPWPYTYDFSTRLRGWRASAAFLDEAVVDTTAGIGQEPFLIANRYQTASALAFYLSAETKPLRPDPSYPAVHIVESQDLQNQFSFWPRYDGLSPGEDGASHPDSPFLGRTALYITDDPERLAPPENVYRAFESFEVSGFVDIVRRGALLRRFKVFTCYNYQGLPL